MNELLCICLFLVIAQASADCQLSAKEISPTNRIFAYRAESELYPLRVDVVPTQQTLEMICNAQNVVKTTCQQKGSFEPPLPMSDCSSPLKASVEVVPDASCSYTMYRVGYKLNQQQFLELYRSCYDVSTMTAHFVIHLTYPSSLTSRPDQSFTTDGVISGAMANSFQAKQIYAQFEKLLGPQQHYVTSPTEMIFDRGHLAPSADFGFEQYMRQSFKYINVVAQFRGINRSNWKTIENWVRKELTSGTFAALKVCTGGLGVLQLPDINGQLKAVYLGEQNNNPVPNWLFKIVGDGSGTRYAFLTYNNVHDTRTPIPNCKQLQCPPSLRLISTKEAGFTFCCDPTDFIIKNVPELATVC